MTSKEILQLIETVFNTAKDSKSVEEVISGTSEEIKKLSDFYSCDPFETLVLSVMIYESVKDNTITNNSIAAILQIPFVEMGKMVRTIWRLSRKKMVKNFISREYGVSYKVLPIVFNSTYYGEMINKSESKADPAYLFLNCIREESVRLFSSDISTSELFLNVKDIIDQNSTLPFVQWIQSLQLNEADTVVFANSCYEHIITDTSISVDVVVNYVFDELYDQFEYKKTFFNGTNRLIALNLINWPEGNINTTSEYVLSAATINKLVLNNLNIKKKEIASKYFTVIKPEDINHELLLYNETEQRQISILKNALAHDNYNTLKENLKVNNYSTGITILFHGFPGTGKTSSVYQIARETNRYLLYTDASSIKSMWLGESEKNIKKLFDDYKSICEQLDHYPILLFNEADAILGNRIKITRSVDQTLNTLQNIILQQLESFEGIFMATTNLTSNLDPAFERRFLYKICFEKPSSEIVDKLLSNAFPQLKDTLKFNNGSKTLTGSNITNIKKRLILKTAFENAEVTPKLIEDLIDEEFYQTDKKNVIGFIQPN